MILINLIIHNKLVKFSEETWRREPLLSIRYTHLSNILFSWGLPKTTSRFNPSFWVKTIIYCYYIVVKIIKQFWNLDFCLLKNRIYLEIDSFIAPTSLPGVIIKFIFVYQHVCSTVLMIFVAT